MPVSGPSSSQLPGFVTLPPPVGSPLPTDGVGTVDDVQNRALDTGPVRAGGLSEQAAAGEVSYAAANKDGINWDALAQDGSLAANLSVSMTAIATLLIQILAEMKKSSKEAGFEEMQTALQTGLDAASKMEDAAKTKFLSSMVSAGMSMAMGLVQMKMATTAQEMAGTKHVSMAPGSKGQLVNSFSESQIQAYNALSQSYQGMGKAVGDIATAFLNLDAGLLEAEAQAGRSTAEYQQAVAQLQKDFAGQIAEAISKALAMMAKISDVQHQATGAIYGM